MDILLLAFVIFSLLFSLATATAIVLVDRRMERRDTHITLRRPGAAPGDDASARPTENVPAKDGSPGDLNPGAGLSGGPSAYRVNPSTS